MSVLRTFALAVLLAACGSTLAGCSVFGFELRSPITRIHSESRFGPGKLTAAAIQSELMSFTDTFDSRLAEQWNRVAAAGRAATDSTNDDANEADQEHARRLRRAAIENKLATVSAALSIASSPNPNVALADMIVMVTLQRMVLETPAASERYGDELVGVLIATYRDQEAKIWRIAARAMTAAQRRELRELIAAWRAENPDATYVANVRLEDFAKARQQSIVETKQSGDSLLALVALDPLAGLDPAQREVQKSRMLGERVFFYGSRLPQLLKWQVESLTQELLRAPELVALSNSLARVTVVAERWPEDLERAQEKFGDTLGTFRATVDATDQAAHSLTVAFGAAEALTARLKAPPETTSSAEAPARNTLADYGVIVAQTGDVADRLTLLAAKLDELLSAPAVAGNPTALQSAASDVQARSKDVIAYAFVRLVVLALLIPFVVALAAALYRRANRLHDERRAADARLVGRST
ncbi:MAG: hypothetical protein K8S98_02255 [Planctomycetes bacterium]|nr:hypothetical protein [Planctomycetota bacterium]